ncbi:hypothetical protein KEM52_000897, partial [Ascosphaera acerosa]
MFSTPVYSCLDQFNDLVQPDDFESIEEGLELPADGMLKLRPELVSEKHEQQQQLSELLLESDLQWTEGSIMGRRHARTPSELTGQSSAVHSPSFSVSGSSQLTMETDVDDLNLNGLSLNVPDEYPIFIKTLHQRLEDECSSGDGQVRQSRLPSLRHPKRPAIGHITPSRNPSNSSTTSKTGTMVTYAQHDAAFSSNGPTSGVQKLAPVASLRTPPRSSASSPRPDQHGLLCQTSASRTRIPRLAPPQYHERRRSESGIQVLSPSPSCGLNEEYDSGSESSSSSSRSNSSRQRGTS